MTKTTRRLLTGDLWRISEHESWFTHMAKEGLHLKKVGKLFAHFAKGEAKDTRYRIETSLNKTITAEQKEFYMESGWEYVTSYGLFSVFSSPAELNAPELHTDPAEQSYTLQHLDKKIALSAIYTVVISIFFLGMFSFLWSLEAGATLALIEGSITPYATGLVVFIGAVFTMIRATLSIRNLRKTLSEGRPINHEAPWRKHRRITLAVSYTIIVIAAIGAVIPWMHLIMNKTETLPLASTDLPLVRLADIEQNTSLVREESGRTIDILNRYSYDWSPFAPLQYESDEYGIVSDSLWKDGSGVYSPSIHTQVYKLSFPTMSEGLITDLVNKYNWRYDERDFILQENEDFDTLLIRESDDKKEVFAAKGKGVIYVRYHGYADMDTIIKSVNEKINLIAK